MEIDKINQNNMKSSSEVIENAEMKELSSTREILDPHRLPEIAFASYDQLKSNSVELRDAFMNGQFRNPDLKYPAFEQENYLEDQYDKLVRAKEQITQVEEDPFKRDVILSTLDYRMVEISYVQKLAQLYKEPAADAEDLKVQVEAVRNLGESLYGKPDPETVDRIFNTIWHKLDQKEFSESGKKLYDELKNGFEFDGKRIDGLPVAKNEQGMLPEDDEELMAWAGDYVLSKNADLEALVRDLWDQKIEQYGADYKATATEAIEFFENALVLRDPEGKSGVSIELDPATSALSWDSSQLAVMVGEDRKPISSANTMLKVILHEFGVHGQRAINGFKTELPVLGSGLFTETEPADYLTFEEGFARILEGAVSNKKFEWSPASLSLYLDIALAERGLDFREIYELTWRYRTLNKLKAGQDVTEELVQEQKVASYKSAVRVFRGTPVLLSEKNKEIKPLTYNKDLTYLNGRLSVMKYFEQAWQDNQNTEMLDRLFLAKFDPTIEEQRLIVEQVFGLEKER